jgi:hypothetical protein
VNNLPGGLPKELSDEAEANGFGEVVAIEHDPLVYTAGLDGSPLRLPADSNLSKGVASIIKMLI